MLDGSCINRIYWNIKKDNITTKKWRIARLYLWYFYIFSPYECATNTPKKSVFISSSDTFDVVSTLAGKVQYFHSPLLCQLYGYNELERTVEIQNLINESDSTSIAFKVEYIVNTDKGIDRRLIHWGKGNWTKEFVNREVTIFKRNLDRLKKRKKNWLFDILVF